MDIAASPTIEVRPRSKRLPWRLLSAALLSALALVAAAEVVALLVGRALSGSNAVAVLRNPLAAERRAFSGKLKVMTYNICHGRGDDSMFGKMVPPAVLDKNLGGVAELLKREAPDVAVLNEVDFDSSWTGRRDQGELLARLAGFPYWVEQRDIDAEIPFVHAERFGNVVLSRFPIRRTGLLRFPPYKRWESVVAGSPAGALCDIGLPGGRSFRLLALHLEGRSEAIRLRSVERIEELRRASREPLVVAGDFNSSPTGFPTSPPADGKSALSILIDAGAYRTLPLRPPQDHRFIGASAFTGLHDVIDWILLPREWAILSRTVRRVPWSDHLPVAMEISLPKG